MDATGDASSSLIGLGAQVLAGPCDLLDAAGLVPRYAGTVQIGFASLRAPIQELGFPIPSHLTAPYLSSDLLASPTAAGPGPPRRCREPGALSSSSAPRRRAILLAKATATSILGLRAGSARAVRRLATSGGVRYDRHRARSRSRRKPCALAHLGYLAKRLAAGRDCLGTSPSHAEKSRAPAALHRRTAWVHPQ